MVEKLLTVGFHHRSRTLPGMTRFGGAHPPKNPQPPNAASLLPQISLKIRAARSKDMGPDIHQQLAKMAPAAAPASDVQQMHLWALSPREMTQLERGLW